VFQNVGVYAYGLDNPHPEKAIAKVVLQAAENGNFWAVLALTLSDAPVFFMPSDVSYGIPDNWGAAAVVYALVEGLAGIQDAGVAFDRVTLAPRWAAAGVKRVTATAKYAASGGYLRYRYRHDAKKGRLAVEFTGNGARVDVRLLLPARRKPRAVRLDGRDVPVATTQIERSLYACLAAEGVGVHKVEVEL
jgi:hypothetical protein